jgi:hypothetical protein
MEGIKMNVLEAMLKELNEEYFAGRHKLPEIRFMRHQSIKIFGRTNREKTLIEMNPVLMKNTNVLRFVMYHELCHAVSEHRIKKRRKFRRFHDKKFRTMEMSYKNFNENKRRFVFFVRDYWLKEGYLTQEELKQMVVN